MRISMVPTLFVPALLLLLPRRHHLLLLLLALLASPHFLLLASLSSTPMKIIKYPVPVEFHIIFEGTTRVTVNVQATLDDFVFELMFPFPGECKKMKADLKNMAVSYRGRIVREDMTLKELGMNP